MEVGSVFKQANYDVCVRFHLFLFAQEAAISICLLARIFLGRYNFTTASQIGIYRVFKADKGRFQNLYLILEVAY